MQGGIACGGMGGMGGGPMRGKTTDAQAKPKLKTLTRTDFLLQFVWKPPKQGDLPKNDEEQKKRISELITKMSEAQKNNPAVKIRLEDLEAASLRKSDEIDSQLQKALSPAGPSVAPGLGQVPPGAAAPGSLPGGPPQQGGARPPGL